MTSDNSLTSTSNHTVENSFNDSLQSLEDPQLHLEQVTTGFYLEEGHLRPDGVFTKGYKELHPYERTAFGGISLKKTKNGQRAKSGIQLERSISPKRGSN